MFLFFPLYQVFKTCLLCSTPGVAPATFQVPRSPAWLVAGVVGQCRSRPFLSQEGTLCRARPQRGCPALSDPSCVFEEWMSLFWKTLAVSIYLQAEGEQQGGLQIKMLTVGFSSNSELESGALLCFWLGCIQNAFSSVYKFTTKIILYAYLSEKKKG